MLTMLVLLFFPVIILFGVYKFLFDLTYKIKISNLFENINSTQDLVRLCMKDFVQISAEIFRRKGYKVKLTDKCGEEGNGLILNNLIYVEIWKYSADHFTDVEAAMKLAKCMRNNSIYRGIFITLGDFKKCTRTYCHTNVIQCINGEQLIAMCREVRKKGMVLQPD